jgi:hypothetical protein
MGNLVIEYFTEHASFKQILNVVFSPPEHGGGKHPALFIQPSYMEALTIGYPKKSLKRITGR